MRLRTSTIILSMLLFAATAAVLKVSSIQPPPPPNLAALKAKLAAKPKIFNGYTNRVVMRKVMRDRTSFGYEFIVAHSPEDRGIMKFRTDFTTDIWYTPLNYVETETQTWAYAPCRIDNGQAIRYTPAMFVEWKRQANVTNFGKVMASGQSVERWKSALTNWDDYGVTDAGLLIKWK